MIRYLSKILPIQNLHVVGVIRKESEEIFYVLTIKKRGTKISIVAKRTFHSLEELQSKIDTKLPVIILMDGKGILNKQIDFNNESDSNWQKNIDYSSIYFTSYKTENYNFISFCRKNIVEETTKAFQSVNLTILDVYIGSFLSALLQNTIAENTIQSGDLELEFENHALYSFTKLEKSNTKSYTIGTDVIYHYELPLYGALLHFFLAPSTVLKSESKNTAQEEFIYKKAFQYFGVFMLISFFTLLLLSYGFIQYYSSKNNALSLENVYSKQTYQKIIDLEKQKEEKLAIIKQSGTFSSKYLTFYAYEICNNIPNSIALKELNIFPADKEIKVAKKINFETNTIRLLGNAQNEEALNQWIKNLKLKNWVQNLEIMSLKKDKFNNTLFEIKITIPNV